MRWLLLGLVLFGCKTEEVRRWEERQQELQERKARLVELASSKTSDFKAMQAHVERVRSELDLVSFVRARGLGARVFVDAHAVRVSVAGTVAACRDVIVGLRERRWLLSEWRLRIEGERCEWEGSTGPAFEQLQAALVEPVRTRWVAPSSELLSHGLAPIKEQVARLEAEVQQLELVVGPLLVVDQLNRRLIEVGPLEQARATCDEAIVDRELALDEGERGKLLELTQAKLVHPLEAKNDFRLRGMVEVVDGKLAWRCE